MTEPTWEIAGDRWTQAEIQLASELARERASIQSLAGRDSQVQLTWLTWARGIIAHRLVVATSVPATMPPPRRVADEPEGYVAEGVHTRARLAMESELTGGVERLWKPALKAGWWCYITYHRAPWIEADGDLKVVTAFAVDLTGDAEEVSIVAMADVLTLVGYRAGKKFMATWVRKPWAKTKRRKVDATYKFESGHMWPSDQGLIPSPALTKLIKEAP